MTTGEGREACLVAQRSLHHSRWYRSTLLRTPHWSSRWSAAPFFQDVLQLPSLRHQLTSKPERAFHLFLETVNLDLRFGGSDSRLYSFTLNFRRLKRELEMATRWHLQDHIICKKHRWSPEATNQTHLLLFILIFISCVIVLLFIIMCLPCIYCQYRQLLNLQQRDWRKGKGKSKEKLHTPVGDDVWCGFSYEKACLRSTSWIWASLLPALSEAALGSFLKNWRKRKSRNSVRRGNLSTLYFHLVCGSKQFIRFSIFRTAKLHSSCKQTPKEIFSGVSL